MVCLPTTHLGVLENSLKRVRAFQIELEFRSVGFEERGKPEYPEKNLSEKGENQDRMQYFTIFQDKLHSVNIQDDKS